MSITSRCCVKQSGSSERWKDVLPNKRLFFTEMERIKTAGKKQFLGHAFMLLHLLSQTLLEGKVTSASVSIESSEYLRLVTKD